MKDTVSEIIDQRVGPGELGSEINRVSSDRKACTKWRNYHLIGDVIRGEVNATGDCLMERINTAVEQEPTVLAPAAKKETVSTNTDAIKSAGMFAVAASLALVAVLTLRPESASVEGGAVIANSTTGQSLNSSTVVNSSTDQQQSFESEFGQMLVEHGEFTATPGLNGLIAYAKMVSNENLDR